jgi:hypothetical protein
VSFCVIEKFSKNKKATLSIGFIGAGLQMKENMVLMILIKKALKLNKFLTKYKSCKHSINSEYIFISYKFYILTRRYNNTAYNLK